MSYIEREKAFDAVFGQFCASSDETEAALNAAIEEIRAIPAADVRENKKRYWYEDEAGCAICSECREYAFETSTHHISGWFPRFCPNCGAKMEES